MTVLLTIVAVALVLLSPVCTQRASAPPALSPEGRAAYDRLAAAEGSTEVEEVVGCTVMRVKVSDVLARIERGECADQLRRPARAAPER